MNIDQLLQLGMYQIVILPDNRILDVLLIETKLDSQIPDILQFFIAGFGYPAISSRIILDMWPDNTRYPGG